mmetsp:Transcript_1591/g.5913  ORF Transcript_1591/g.5913 Transcript_1591/m.5913 type:complete len:213 (-) Transcript_1591:613-1251(-)
MILSPSFLDTRPRSTWRHTSDRTSSSQVSSGVRMLGLSGDPTSTSSLPLLLLSLSRPQSTMSLSCSWARLILSAHSRAGMPPASPNLPKTFPSSMKTPRSPSSCRRRPSALRRLWRLRISASDLCLASEALLSSSRDRGLSLTTISISDSLLSPPISPPGLPGLSSPSGFGSGFAASAAASSRSGHSRSLVAMADSRFLYTSLPLPSTPILW